MKTKSRSKPLRDWANRTKKKQSGGFLSLIIAALIAAGISASTAATAASIIVPVATGALGAIGAASANAIIKQAGGKGKPVRRARTKPLLLQTRSQHRRR